jgi:hypothetical protein
MIATVRVANPNHPGHYMTINASDYRERVHGPLWEEQAEDFAGTPPAPVHSYGQQERDFAGALMLEIFDFQMMREGRNFGAMSSAERLTFMRDQRQEFMDHRDGYLRERQVSDSQRRQWAGEGIIPGQTPGHPVDAVSGEPMALSDEQRSTLANIMLPDPGTDGATNGTSDVRQEPGRPELVQLDESLPDPLPPLGDADPAHDQGAAPAAPVAGITDGVPAAPAPGAGAETTKPAWAAAPAPATDALKVEKGPGGKWYVKRAKEVLSEGFGTKAEAEAALPSYEVK